MIRIYTDGSCLGNPGPGGWAAVIEEEGARRTLAGREDDATNNRMEVLAAIKGLEAVPERSEVTVFSDSQYLVNTMTRNWKRKANLDLWARLDAVVKSRRVHWEWVPGHAGHPGNEEANALANQQLGLPPESKGRPMQSVSKGREVKTDEPSRIYIGAAWDSSTKRGAWTVIVDTGLQPEITASNVMANSNPSRLELTSAIKGLNLARASGRVEIRSYSEYLLRCGSGSWERRANKELWKEIEQLVQGKEVGWIEDRGVQVARAHDRAVALLAGKAEVVEAAEETLPETVLSAQEQEEESITSRGQEATVSLTHLDSEGRARMVDVGWKEATARVAVARGSVRMKPETLRLIQEGQVEKGDVLAVARIAGIMGAKRTSELVPLCHPIPLDQVTVELEPDESESAIHITATARTTAKTGVEMEALTAVSVAALTIYDMAKAVDRGMRIEGVRLVSKRGGKSGDIYVEP